MKIFAYVLMALAFSTILPDAHKMTDATSRRIFSGIGFAVLATGFTIYSNAIKKEILEEVKRLSQPSGDNQLNTEANEDADRTP